MNYKSNGEDSVNVVLEKIKTGLVASDCNRDISWEDCHSAFRYVYKKGFKKGDSEFLSLHLTGYLASWGMYRGSSDLLKKYKYLIHVNLIEILYQEKYLPLFNVDEKNFNQNILLIKSIYKEIENYYHTFCANDKCFNPSETLVTKIMLGVYGCVPAYDRNLVKGLQYYNIQRSGNKKFESLQVWLDNNSNFVVELLDFGNKNFANRKVLYPFMKLVDMYFCNLDNKEHKK